MCPFFLIIDIAWPTFRSFFCFFLFATLRSACQICVNFVCLLLIFLRFCGFSSIFAFFFSRVSFYLHSFCGFTSTFALFTSIFLAFVDIRRFYIVLTIFFTISRYDWNIFLNISFEPTIFSLILGYFDYFPRRIILLWPFPPREFHIVSVIFLHFCNSSLYFNTHYTDVRQDFCCCSSSPFQVTLGVYKN